jgi:hypothetical protein
LFVDEFITLWNISIVAATAVDLENQLEAEQVGRGGLHPKSMIFFTPCSVLLLPYMYDKTPGSSTGAAAVGWHRWWSL